MTFDHYGIPLMQNAPTKEEIEPVEYKVTT